jgi:hypothetical protein
VELAWVRTPNLTKEGVDVEEQSGFVVEGKRVALGPLRMDLVATYLHWDNDLEVLNANGWVIRLFTNEGVVVAGSRRPRAGFWRCSG